MVGMAMLKTSHVLGGVTRALLLFANLANGLWKARGASFSYVISVNEAAIFGHHRAWVRWVFVMTIAVRTIMTAHM